MSAPEPAARDPRRERLVALLFLGVAVVLLVSSVSWFGSGQAGWGIVQLVLGVALAVTGAVLHRRSRRA